MNFVAQIKNSVFGETLVRRTPLFYGRFRVILEKISTATLDERKAFSDNFLFHILQTAAKTQYGCKCGGGLNYSAWPDLEKETLRDSANRLTLRSLLPVSQAATSGTTGIPINLQRSWRSVVFEQAVLDHIAAMSGIIWSRARIAVLRGDTIKDPTDLTPPFWVEHHSGRHLVMSSNHLSRQTVSNYQEALRRFRPDMIWCYPSSLEVLCKFSKPGDLHLPTLHLICSSSEILSAEMNQLARSIFGVPICDFYGQAERVCASYSMAPNEHYFIPTYGRVELRYSHTDDNVTYWSIIGTSFWNERQPLVRYRTGDFALIPQGASKKSIEAIELGILPFLGIAGRQSAYLVSPDGVHLMGIGHIPRGIPNVAQMQFHQTTRDSVEIWLVPMEQYSPETEHLVLRQARQKIPENMRILIKRVDRLYRTTRGKTPMIIRNFKDEK